MSRQSASKRRAPDAHDHLWPLLPVFAAFLVVIVFAAAAYERQPRMGKINELEAPPTQPYVPAATDASVPSADAAMARLPEAVPEPVATF
jgi:hypothetical protein